MRELEKIEWWTGDWELVALAHGCNEREGTGYGLTAEG